MEWLNTTVLLGILVVVVALLFDFSNGFHDSSNIVATMISTRAVSPGWALFIAAFFEFIGAYFLGTAVARTMVSGIVDPFLLKGAGDIVVIIAALLSAIGWNILTWYFGMPSSSSHALIGSLLGAFFCGFGYKVFIWSNVIPIIIVLICAPLVSFLVTYFITNIFYVFGRWFTSSINVWLKRLQILSAIGVAMASGTNDAQKTMGVITFSLIILGLYSGDGATLVIPHWVIISCSVMLGLGIATGGKRIIKTLGSRLYKMRAIHGFSAQTNSLVTIFVASIFGFPLSTTQVVTSSIMGAGASEGFKRVRWNVFMQVVFTWMITLPVTFTLGYLICIILRQI